MNKIIHIKNLDCPNCAKELEEEILHIKGVKDVNVDFINQKVYVNCNEEILDEVKRCCNNFEEVEVIEKIESSFKICNLDCPNCAKELEEEISKINDVKHVSVDFINQKVFVTYSKKNTLMEAKNICNNFEEVKVVDDNKIKFTHFKEIIILIISSLLFVLAIIFEHTLIESYSYVSLILYILSYLVIGHPVIIMTFKNILKGRIFDENFLMTIASIGAMIIGETIEGVAVMILYQLGELLQTIAVESSRREIVSLMELQSETATLIINGEAKIVSPEELKIGDIIQIKKGEKVPVDCLNLEEVGLFDTKSITGESFPKEILIEQEILSGYINIGNLMLAKVIRTYENSAAQKILNIVENSTSKKAQPEKFITRFAKYYTPIVVISAFILGVIVPLILGLINNNWSEVFSSYIYRALVLLVISCPCALIISVPLTYFGGIGACAKRGVLLKGAINLDILSNIDIMAFDKTGTLTEGSFKITNVNGDNNMLLYASALEKASSHPIAKAFENIETPYKIEKVDEIIGKGLKSIIEGKKCIVGNLKLMNEYQIACQEIKSLSTILYVAYDNQYLGYIEIDDILKENAKKTMVELKKLGVKKLIMLSGDHNERVQKIAEELNLDEGYGELLPSQKLKKAQELKNEHNLVYIGDGINDTLVMNEASCSISMGKLGSDAAIETSDVVLVSDNLYEVVNTIKLAKRTKRIVYQNIIFSIMMKVIFMVLGILNVIPLFIAVFADVGVMLIAVLNSLRMKLKIKE